MVRPEIAGLIADLAPNANKGISPVKVIASSVRKGNVLDIDGKLYVVLTAESFHPGKGTPTTQIDMRRISDGSAYLQPEMKVMLSMHGDNAVAIQLPQKVVLEVTETEPVTKGQTASSSYKPATLSNGVRTNVPPFIGTGTRIVVMTEDGSYVERAKD